MNLKAVYLLVQYNLILSFIDLRVVVCLGVPVVMQPHTFYEYRLLKVQPIRDVFDVLKRLWFVLIIFKNSTLRTAVLFPQPSSRERLCRWVLRDNEPPSLFFSISPRLR
jgi:hypothetical protein